MLAFPLPSQALQSSLPITATCLHLLGNAQSSKHRFRPRRDAQSWSQSIYYLLPGQADPLPQRKIGRLAIFGFASTLLCTWESLLTYVHSLKSSSSLSSELYTYVPSLEASALHCLMAARLAYFGTMSLAPSASVSSTPALLS